MDSPQKPSAAEPQPKQRFGIGDLTAKDAKSAKKEIGISLAKALRRKGKKNKIPNLASLREKYPNSIAFDPCLSIGP